MAKKTGKKSSSPRKAARQLPPPAGGQLERLAITNLDLDSQNPRLGLGAGTRKNQTEILDHIVEQFGIEDVLGSIACNGYFDAEPLVGFPTKNDRYTIAEGNRRLAALLILAGDERARNQQARIKKFDKIRKEHNVPPINKVPVLLYSNPKEQHLLSYLGVRHISSSQPWDSYAKAAWIDRVMSEDGMTVKQISEMIGDQHRTVARIVEGYQFIRDLIETGYFNPSSSSRSGRGSNSDFPFSWIYTILGYKPVREWLNLDELGSKPKIELTKSSREKGSKLTRYLFGDRTTGKNAAIADSREIGLLAQAISDPEGRVLLEQGKSVHDFEDLSKPLHERLESALLAAKQELEECQKLMPQVSDEVTTEQVQSLAKISSSVYNLANAVRKHMVSIDHDSAPDQ